MVLVPVKIVVLFRITFTSSFVNITVQSLSQRTPTETSALLRSGRMWPAHAAAGRFFQGMAVVCVLLMCCPFGISTVNGLVASVLLVVALCGRKWPVVPESKMAEAT